MKDLQITWGEWRKKDSGVEISLANPNTLKEKGFTEHPGAGLPIYKNFNPKRTSGFYWVIWNGVKQVAEYDGEYDCWFLTATESSYNDSDFSMIDERVLCTGD